MIGTTRSDLRAAAALQPMRILYWVYAGRLVISLAVYGTAILLRDFLAPITGAVVTPETGVVSLFGLVAAAVLTPLAYWHSHLRRRRPRPLFLFTQATLDILLATGIVHITGGSGSPFVFFYILLAASYALILPVGSAVLVALGGGAAYLIEVAVGYPGQFSPAVLLQVLVFTLVASATGIIGGRLRQVRQELRSVEGELRRLRLDTADILRSIPSGVLTLDGGGRLAYVNLAAAELLGLRVEEALGRDVLPRLEALAPALAEAVRETMATGRRIRNRELELHPAGGDRSGAGDPPAPPARPIPVALSTTLLKGEHREPFLIVLLQDLQAVRQLEDLRLRTGRLEAVAELSASLAHELRNPLASIRSAVEQLSAAAREDADDAVLGRLIVRESDRLDRVLGEFSDFARVDVTERTPIDVERLLRDVVETVRQHPAAQGRARFEIEIADSCEGLWGDPELLHRTLLNLVLNAVQVGDRRRPVRVRVLADSLRPDLVPAEVALGSPVRVRVVDDGPGIDPEDLPRIFDPFYTRREGGSGLGLSIAHRAVQAHGGALLASSTPGGGATFAVVLPRRARPRATSDSGGGSSPPAADPADDSAPPAPVEAPGASS